MESITPTDMIRLSKIKYFTVDFAASDGSLI